MDTCIGGASVGNTGKAGWKTDSVQSVENRQCYETKEKSINLSVEVFSLLRMQY